MESLSCHTHIYIYAYTCVCICMYISTFITLTCRFPRKAKKCITPPGPGFTDISEPPHVGARSQTWIPYRCNATESICSSKRYHYNTENEYSPSFHPHHLEVMKVPATCSVTNWMNLMPLWIDSAHCLF